MSQTGKHLAAGECTVESFMVRLLSECYWVIENIVQRELFVGERNWETDGCRGLHIGELHGECC